MKTIQQQNNLSGNDLQSIERAVIKIEDLQLENSDARYKIVLTKNLLKPPYGREYWILDKYKKILQEVEYLPKNEDKYIEEKIENFKNIIKQVKYIFITKFIFIFIKIIYIYIYI